VTTSVALKRHSIAKPLPLLKQRLMNEA